MSEHKAGAAAEHLRQRYLAFYPEDGSELLGEVADAPQPEQLALVVEGVHFGRSSAQRTQEGTSPTSSRSISSSAPLSWIR